VFVGDRNLRTIVNGFSAENVALIKDISDRTAAEIEKACTRALTSGTLHKDLAKELQRKFKLGEDRSKLIARDQIGKLYGQINAQRQRDLGVEHFIWRTVQDDRVRDEHEERNGERYSYSDPPDGELPGEPILCRCYAEPDFSVILGASE
jgi:SPP1 gp7 family putative phage head morphogenesis protein